MKGPIKFTTLPTALVIATLMAILLMSLVACGSSSLDTYGSADEEEGTAIVSDTIAQDEENVEAPEKIACVGDSITWGYGVYDTRDTDSYPAQLQALISGGGFSSTVENYGYNGACALSDGKNPYVDTQEYADSLASGANMVILMLGTDDAASVYWDQTTYEEALSTFVESYQSMTSAPTVVLMVPPSIYSDTWAGGVSAAAVSQMQQGVRDVAEKYGLTCIDLDALTSGRTEWFADGVHPNKEGNAQIAQYVYDTIL